MGNRSVRVWAVLASLAAVGVACEEPEREAAERLARVKDEGAQLYGALDEVEERLLGNQAQVHLWQELGRRHNEVSALACDNMSSHAMEMAKRLDLQQERTRRLRRGRHHPRPEAMTAVPVNAARSRSN